MFARAWDRYWFSPTPLKRLGAVRIIMMLLVLMNLMTAQGAFFVNNAQMLTSGRPMGHWNPIYLIDVIGAQPIGRAEADRIMSLAFLAAGMGLAGILTRLSCLVTAILYVYITAMVYSYGKPHHDQIALTFCLLALPLAPVGARLSLDSLVSRFRRSRKGAHPALVPEVHAFAGLPIRLTMVTAALGYGFAGWSKVVASGFDWANGYTLMSVMMSKDNTMSTFLSSHVGVAQALSIGTLLMQTMFPLALFIPTLRWLLLPGAVSFHMGTWASMDTGPYMSLWLCLVCFLALEQVPAWVRVRPFPRLLVAAVPVGIVLFVFWASFPWWFGLTLIPLVLALGLFMLPRTRMAIVFDGSCRFCRGVVSVILGLDWGRVIEAVDLRDWEQVKERWPELDQDACIRDMHVVGVKTHSGYAAYRQLAWRLPVLAPFAWVMHLPPVAAIGKRVYRSVADKRLRDQCGLAKGDGGAAQHE